MSAISIHDGLLGLIATAGYQNRDKIAEMLRGATSSGPGASGQPQPGKPQPQNSRRVLGNWAAQAQVGCSAAGSASWSNASGRMARATSQKSGSGPAPTRRSHPTNSSRRSDRTCWPPCRNRPACLARRSCSGPHENCPRQLTSTRLRAACRRSRTSRAGLRHPEQQG